LEAALAPRRLSDNFWAMLPQDLFVLDFLIILMQYFFSNCLAQKKI
jgi:hypothetical protein